MHEGCGNVVTLKENAENYPKITQSILEMIKQHPNITIKRLSEGMALSEKTIKNLQIHINKKREAHSSLASLLKAPENCLCCRNEQLRTSCRYRYINPYTPAMPIVRIHHRLTSIIRAV